nr:uncharacterized protein LOC124495776 [Dermatophagoides farinae]
MAPMYSGQSLSTTTNNNNQQTNSDSSSSSSSTTDSSDRWHTVSAYVGSELSIPCAIDVSGCGRIYFITWTKNVSTSSSSSSASDSVTIMSSNTASDHHDDSQEISSDFSFSKTFSSSSSSATTSSPSPSPSSSQISKSGEWQRVFIHSDTFERVLGDLEQFGPKNRVRFGPKNLSQTNFAHLTLHHVVPEDDGIYKCDVTYVTPHAHGKCPSLTYIRVQTLVKPSSPIIRINGKSLAEYRMSMDSVITVDDGGSGDYSSAKSLSSSSQLSNQTLSNIDLNRYRQFGPFEEGSTIVFECSTFGGRPMPELRWFNGSRPLRSKITVMDLDPDSLDQSNDPDLIILTSDHHHHHHQMDGSSAVRRKIIATTRIIASRFDLGAKFECRVLWNNTQDDANNGDDGFITTTTTTNNNASLLNDWLLLDIQVRPLVIRVDSPRSPVIAGETVLLRCTVDGARPSANITWYNRSEVVQAEPLPTFNHLISTTTKNKQSSENKITGPLVGPNQPVRTRITTELMTDGTFRTTSILAFVASRSDHQADFFCKGSNEILRNRNEVPLLQGVQLQVLYAPVVAIEPDGLIAVNESSTVQFWCTYDANPMNISEIRWYKDHRLLDTAFLQQQPNDDENSNKKIFMSRDERGTPMLTIRNIDRNDSANYKCRIRNKFGASDSITTARLEVAYPPIVSLEVVEPKNQIIEERSDTPVMPTMTLRCTTLHGNPSKLQTVNWYRNGRHFITTISFHKLQQQRQSASSQIIPTISSTLSLSSSTTTTTTPSFLHHSFYHRIGTGKHFTLIDESTPLSGPLNGQFLLTPNGTSWSTNNGEPYVHYLNEPEILIIANVTREHRGNYSCIGFNGASNGSRLSAAKIISVKYPPGPASLMLTSSSNSDTNNRYILKGTQAVLECRIDDPGDPPANSIIWTHNGVRIDRATTHFQPPPPPPMTSDSVQQNPLIARYRTPKADMSTSGEYRCRAINDLGQGEWGQFRLDVKSPPRILQSLPATIGALSDQNLTLTCRVECQPPCEIHWFHNNLTRLSPDTRGILPSSLLTNEYRAKLRNGNEMIFSLINEQSEGSIQGPSHTWSSFTIHNTSVLFDFDQLTCVSSNSDTEELGPPVHSTVVFRREYLPHSVHLSVPGIDLLEGEGYPEKPIQCSAFGNPTPRYYWTFEPFVPTQGYYSHENHSRNNQTIVAIGPQLTLDKSMAQNPQGKILETSMEFQLDVTTTSSSHHNQLNGRFHATRTLSGNYTCVATNQHGSSSSTLTINVFYRPECELRRINTAKILHNRHRSQDSSSRLDRQQQQPVPIMLSCTAISNPAPGKFSWYRRNGSELMEIHPSLNSDHSLFVAISQDYDYASDSSGATAVFDYYHQQPQQQNRHHNHFQSDNYDDVAIVGHSVGGHTRQSIVMGVPADADLDEYACVVSNAIGESRPCWYEETPTSGQIMSSSTGGRNGLGQSTADSAYDNLFMVAASAGLIVFCLVLFSAVAIVFCLHRNGSRTGGGASSSFKGFGGSRNSVDDDINTPQRLKLNRPAHHLLMLDAHHSTSDQPLDSAFIVNTMDTNCSKTATLTAGYRMAGTMSNHHHQQQLTTPLITGTLSKSSFYHHQLRQQNQNHYSTADGSIYDGGMITNSDDGGDLDLENSASKPFLVSYPSPSGGHNDDSLGDGTSPSANPVYAEPDYHCLQESSSSVHGDGQLTGSTSVTTSSGNNSNTSNLQILPPLPPPDITKQQQRFTMAKFNNSINKQGNNKANHMEMDSINHHQTDDNDMIEDHYENNPYLQANYEEVREPKLIALRKKRQSSTKLSTKSQRTDNNNLTNNGQHHSGSDYSDSGDFINKSNAILNPANKESIECLVENNNRGKSHQTIEPDYESYDDDDDGGNDYEDDDDDSSVPSTAYKPERDFFFIHNNNNNQNRSQQQQQQFRSSLSSNNDNNLSSSSRRRLLPSTNKYGSLIRQHNPQSDQPSNNSSPRFVNNLNGTPQQYHQSPISTRLYYNFDHPTNPTTTTNNSIISSANGNSSSTSSSSPNPFYNSLRSYNNNNWRNSSSNNRHHRGGGNSGMMIRQHSDNNNYPQIAATTTNVVGGPTSSSSSSCFRRSESTEPLQQQEPPDYHQTILDRFYNEQQQQQQQQQQTPSTFVVTRSNIDNLYG